jgi:coenzyme Q-binding protein COQ10
MGDASVHDLDGGWEQDFPRYSPAQLFALVSDIESYPGFVPGCVATRILERGETVWLVDNVFGFGPFRRRFTTRAELDAPNGLLITSSDDPWRSFRLSWRLEPLTEGCRLICSFALGFRSATIGALAPLVMAEMDRRIIAAFEKRAAALYG